MKEAKCTRALNPSLNRDGGMYKFGFYIGPVQNEDTKGLLHGYEWGLTFGGLDLRFG